jgi:glycosyltransferase involved in cell wall biosynthesis
MMDDFIKASKIKNNIELNIYGSVDSIGYRFINYSRIDHILLDEFNRILKLSGGVIKYHGQKSSEEMNSIYRDHDYFISMSTYQDEDYGLAAAQSIASNCYPILSKWGGYRDFECAKHIETKLMSNFHFTYNRKRLIQTICNPPKIHKEEMLEYSIKNFYPDAIVLNLLNILEKESKVYSGQSSLFWKYRNLYKKNSGQPYINIKNSLEVESVYKSVYHSYYE